jgi:transcriptional regulator with XRE-family HTH domain
MSMGELARRINYSKSYLSKIENDFKSPSALVARRALAHAYSGEVDEACVGAGSVLTDARSSTLRPCVSTCENSRERWPGGASTPVSAPCSPN